jgi:hypothetical protein
LRKLQREIRFALEVVDIESDAGLFDRYWDRVPVVAVDGREVAEALIEPWHLRTLIAS